MCLTKTEMSVLLTVTVRKIITAKAKQLLDDSGFNGLPNRDELRTQMWRARDPRFQMGVDDFIPTREDTTPTTYVAFIRTALLLADDPRKDAKFFQVRLTVDPTTMPIETWSEDDWYAFVLDGYRKMVDLLRDVELAA